MTRRRAGTRVSRLGSQSSSLESTVLAARSTKGRMAIGSISTYVTDRQTMTSPAWPVESSANKSSE